MLRSIDIRCDLVVPPTIVRKEAAAASSGPGGPRGPRGPRPAQKATLPTRAAVTLFHPRRAALAHDHDDVDVHRVEFVIRHQLRHLALGGQSVRTAPRHHHPVPDARSRVRPPTVGANHVRLTT